VAVTAGAVMAKAVVVAVTRAVASEKPTGRHGCEFQRPVCSLSVSRVSRFQVTAAPPQQSLGAVEKVVETVEAVAAVEAVVKGVQVWAVVLVEEEVVAEAVAEEGAVVEAIRTALLRSIHCMASRNHC